MGSSTWGTSIFPSKEMGSFLLPLKKPVRVAEGLGVGTCATSTCGSPNSRGVVVLP
ncbi:MAG: DUF1905 domain-containing protein [Actinomycetota bacterium]|nr:DUF1905 domain-containing protein [Actinomycetota bacterium]